MGSLFSYSLGTHDNYTTEVPEEPVYESPWNVFLQAVNRYDRINEDTTKAVLFEVFMRSVAPRVIDQIKSALGHIGELLRELPRELAVPMTATETSTFREKVYGKHDSPTCSICLDTIQSSDKTLPIQCGHVFHSHCLRTWMGRAMACPLCRSNLRPLV